MAGADGFRDGLLYGGGLGQLYVQAQGVVATAVFVGGLSVVVWWAIRRTIGMRVSREEELLGLDLGEMGMEAYPVSSERDAGLVPSAARRLARSTSALGEGVTSSDGGEAASIPAQPLRHRV